MRVPDPKAPVWIDGRLASPEAVAIPIDDPAFQSGVGVFETIAVRDGRTLELQEHLQRLERDAGTLAVPLPDSATLLQAVREVACRQPAAYAWLKIVATRGGRCVVFGGAMDPADEGRAVSAVLLPWRRNPRDPTTGVKTLNYAASTLGTEEAERRGADEGIWLNTRGHLAEASTSNLFVVDKRKLFTPSVRDGILAGVVRGLALESARSLGFAIHEGRIRLRRLETADEAFLTSSVRGVRPLIAFQGRPVGRGEPGPATRAIAAEVARRRRFDDAPGHAGQSTPRAGRGSDP